VDDGRMINGVSAVRFFESNRSRSRWNGGLGRASV